MDNLAYVNTIFENITSFMLIFTRIFAMLFSITIFRREMATIRILISLALILAFYVLILTKPLPFREDVFSISFVLQSLTQTMIGFISGMFINIVLEVFSSAGQIISMQIGLSTASLFDPKFGMITSLTHFYVITGMILFFGMNGHLIIIDMIVKSFYNLPADQIFTNFHTNQIIKYASVIFRGGVIISLTLISAIMLTNICLAIMSKFAPQFNLFSVGLNMSLVIGLICIYLTYEIALDRGSDYLRDAFNHYKLYFTEFSQNGGK